MTFREYLSHLFQSVPPYIFVIAGLAFIIGGVLVLLTWGFLKGWRKICALFLVEYLGLIYCSTVLFRRTIERQSVSLIPFSRYDKMINGTSSRIEPELIMNVLVFVPVGLFMALIFKNVKWWKGLLIGGGVSLSIEVLQYCLNKGTAEMDDVIHNVAGCMIGYGVYTLIKMWHKKNSKRSVGAL